MPAGDFGPPGGRDEHTTHAEAARQAALALVAARAAGDDRQARRHLARLRRALEAHLAAFRAERRRRLS